MTLPAPTGSPYRIAFVCLGNICRSPMASVVLAHLVNRAGLAGKVEVSSCGTGGWHVGQTMDPRAADQLLAEGYDPSRHRARQFDAGWLEQDLVLAMDRSNLADITAGGKSDDHVRLFRTFDPLVPAGAPEADLDTPDPYYGGDEGFVELIAMVERCCRAILAELETLPL